ncbi:MAG: helix-turn-helix domain-containing protein [Rhodospirillaceae bacterium]|jgi:transcriptional regulator with XRE-family HTH domain|nr:helix-turn-helix domain-containing protein [Rhodospirillaceae bacterium]MBT5455538.1 helix-turn-helix domain-containing protein [Rhodospirillaceae bacterium]
MVISSHGKTPGPHPVDIIVGKRVRGRRILMGLSQERLGDDLGVTFQQVQKYERGSNRISASRLYEISRVLEVPPSYFFEEIIESEGLDFAGVDADATDPMTKRETLELVRAYYKIIDPKIRQELCSLIRSLGQPDK